LSGGLYPQWGPGGKELYYLAPDNQLMAVDLNISGDDARPSNPHVLFTMPIVDNGWPPYDTSPDGQQFLVRAVSGATFTSADVDCQLAGAAEEELSQSMNQLWFILFQRENFVLVPTWTLQVFPVPGIGLDF